MPRSAEATAPLLRSNRSRVLDLWRAWRRKPLGLAGIIVVLLMILAAVLAEQLAPYNPTKVDMAVRLHAPSAQHWAGTDGLGRDVLTRMLFGARISLVVSFGTVALSMVVGTLLGLVTGYFRGAADLLVQRIVDAFQAFPLLIIAMLFVATLGASIPVLIVALTAASFTGQARVARAVTLSIREMDYVTASKAMGCKSNRILFTHVLPNVFPHLIVLGTASLGGIILAESSLSFLGFGAPPPIPTWGGILGKDGINYMDTAPWLAIIPGVALTVVVLSFNLAGDALRDILDPRLKGSR